VPLFLGGVFIRCRSATLNFAVYPAWPQPGTPAQQLKELIDEVNTGVGFIIVGMLVGIQVELEMGD